MVQKGSTFQQKYLSEISRKVETFAKTIILTDLKVSFKSEKHDKKVMTSFISIWIQF